MVHGIAHREKQYVEVVAKHDEDGAILPLRITLPDGRRFNIDAVLDRRQASALKVGGNGLRYRIRIGQSETFLYYECPRWFVEAKVYESNA